MIRIVPALAVETTLSALLLGPLFTSLPLAVYAHAPAFHHYFLNIVGEIHFTLPGVFDHNPKPGMVNGQLWTLPFELRCYAVLALFAFIAVVHKPKLFAPFIGVITAACFIRYGLAQHHEARVVTVDGVSLILAFLWGVALFLSRRLVPWSASLATIAAALTLLGLAIPGGDQLATLPAAYLTAYLGLLHPPKLKILFSGDYSYGIFLYGYPIQQAARAICGPVEWWQDFAIAFPVIVAWAAMSWWAVELPALRLRSQLLALEAWGVKLTAAIPAGRWLLPITGAPQKA